MGVFETQLVGRDLDPQVCQLVRRVALLRRELAKKPAIEPKVKNIVKAYNEKLERIKKKNQAEGGEGEEAGKGVGEGPIGYLVDELYAVGQTLSSSMGMRGELMWSLSRGKASRRR